MNQIQITIEGTVGVGKSAIAEFLQFVLGDIGIEVTINDGDNVHDSSPDEVEAALMAISNRGTKVIITERVTPKS